MRLNCVSAERATLKRLAGSSSHSAPLAERATAIVREFKFRSRGKSEATEFRFAAEQFRELRTSGDTGREILGVCPTTEDAS